MKRVSRVLAAVAALVFASCGTNPEPNDTAGSATTEASAITHDAEQPDHSGSQEPPNSPDTDVKTQGPGAADSLEHLLTTLNTVYNDNVGHGNFSGECDAPFATLEEFRQCSPDDPIAYLDSIEAPQRGELIVTLLPDSWGGGEYDPDRVFTVPYLAEILHGYIGRHTNGILQVTTTTPDGEYQATQGRLPTAENSDAPTGAAELEAWADERFDDWLRSMNFTYQGLCGGVDSVADYRQCVPDDPHGYITDFEAPVAGELVVRIEKGPWQGGPYEPAATFMAGNMMLKIASYSNDVDLLTVITPDGETHTVEYAPSGYTDTTREPTV